MECFGYNTGMLRSREQNGEGVAPPKAGLFSFAQGLALALLTLSSWYDIPIILRSSRL